MHGMWRVEVFKFACVYNHVCYLHMCTHSSTHVSKTREHGHGAAVILVAQLCLTL